MSHVSQVSTNASNSVYATDDTASANAGRSAETRDIEALLPAPGSAVGDAVTDMAILLAQLALDDRKDSRMQALLDDQRAVRAGLARVSAMRAAATEREWAGLAKGIAQAADGAMQLTGVAMAAGGASESDCKILAGAGKAGDGVNAVFVALIEHSASQADAFAARKEIESGSAVRAHDAARDDARSAQELYDRLVQAYKQVVETRNAALLAAVRG